ncbi:hypothetical protein DSM112329_01963 [Paraconexibacter sp. AEG42_29]|uniref:Uncharacterized protein n=1 Tax=Paraconexibacter sp. AEG42_29 TaxID=2997339 RepID=A0AAU7AU31_9ACTN
MTGPSTEAARLALVQLHRELLDEQRKEVERVHGRLTAMQALQAATEDQRFAWLGPLAGLITELDAARAEQDEPRADAALVRVDALLRVPDPATAFGYRYLDALQQHPAVVLAHRDLVAALPRR